MTTMTTPRATNANGTAASDWIRDNMRPLGITAALLALLFVLWLIFAPAKYEPFTIGSGQGINAHVDYPTAIDLAEKNGLPLYTGQGWNESNRIGYDAARAMLDNDELGDVQVTVRVRTGDHFDADGVYHPAGSVITAK